MRALKITKFPRMLKRYINKKINCPKEKPDNMYSL